MDHRSLPTPNPRRRRRMTAVAGSAAVFALGLGLAACGSDTKAEDETSSVTGRLETTTTTAGSSTTTKQSGSNGGGSTGGGGGSSSSGTTPTIGSFSTPEDIDCHNGNFQEFTASWTTTNATKVTISIDGPGVYDTYPANGSASLPFNCSSSHTFLLTAYGSDGSTTTEQITLQPRNAQSGSTTTTA